MRSGSSARMEAEVSIRFSWFLVSRREERGFMPVGVSMLSLMPQLVGLVIQFFQEALRARFLVRWLRRLISFLGRRRATEPLRHAGRPVCRFLVRLLWRLVTF